jgi:inorganic pyrophosphatase
MANINHKPSKYMLNLLHVLPAFVSEERKVLNGLVEINHDSINKYEFITESGHLKLDRVGYSSLAYPVAYGLIPQTWDQDRDMLDFVIANVTEPLVPGSLAEVRVIGIMKFEDNGERDDKIITVLSEDKRMDHIDSYKDLGEHWEREATHYFEHYKDLKKPGTCKVLGFFEADEAIKVIKECETRYKEEYPELESVD